jgi:LPS-assembly protein
LNLRILSVNTGTARPFHGAETSAIMKRPRDGAVQVLEPVAQLVWAPDELAEVPNVDSTVVEFGEGNLFTFSRFPGSDRRELGARANLGLTWSRVDPDGWSARLAGGRVFRAEDLGQFTATSGLDGVRSDWLLAAQLDTGSGLRLTNRALLGEEFGVVRDELRLDWSGRRANIAASYIWIEAEPAENRPDDSAEFFLDGGFGFRENWTGSIEARYDFSAGRVADAGLGLRYTNECVDLGLSLSRRFTSSASVEPNTDVALEIALNGFGTGNDGRRYRKSCGF